MLILALALGMIACGPAEEGSLSSVTIDGTGWEGDQLTATPHGGKDYTYAWTKDETSAGSDATITSPTVGTYKVVVTDGDGETAEDTIAVAPKGFKDIIWEGQDNKETVEITPTAFKLSFKNNDGDMEYFDFGITKWESVTSGATKPAQATNLPATMPTNYYKATGTVTKNDGYLATDATSPTLIYLAFEENASTGDIMLRSSFATTTEWQNRTYKEKAEDEE